MTPLPSSASLFEAISPQQLCGIAISLASSLAPKINNYVFNIGANTKTLSYSGIAYPLFRGFVSLWMPHTFSKAIDQINAHLSAHPQKRLSEEESVDAVVSITSGAANSVTTYAVSLLLASSLAGKITGEPLSLNQMLQLELIYRAEAIVAIGILALAGSYYANQRVSLDEHRTKLLPKES